MTGIQIAEMSAKLLGYASANGNLQLSERIMTKALVIVNLVYSDLWRICKTGEFKPLSSLSEKINLPERALSDVMPYGIAMMMSQLEDDGDQQQLFSMLYNQKRSGLSKIEKLEDVMPNCIY